jgi:hypothetical protein
MPVPPAAGVNSKGLQAGRSPLIICHHTLVESVAAVAKRPKNLLRFRGGFGVGDLNRLVAELDENLPQYYIGEEIYTARAVDRHDPASIFVGPKGVGKSAILQMVKVTRQRTGDGGRVIIIKPDELAFNALVDVDARTPILSSPSENLWLFTSLWNYVLTTEILRRERGGVGWLESKMVDWFGDQHHREQRRLLQIASRDTGEEVETSLTDKMLRMVSEVEVSGEAAGGNKGALSAKLREGQPRRDVNMLQLVSNVAKRLPDTLEHPYHVLIDDLDLNWRGGGLQNAFLGAMFSSIVKLTRTQTIKFCVSLRDYIFHEIHLPERDKLSDLVVNVRWGEGQVRQMVAARLSYLMQLRTDDVWQHLFPPKAAAIIGASTTGTPREMISLSVEAVKYAMQAGHQRVQESDLKEAIRLFSKRQVSDFKGRNESQLPGLSVLLDVLRGGPKEFGLERVQESCMNAADVAKRRGETEKFAMLSHGFETPISMAEQLMRLGFLMLKDGRSSSPRVPEPEEFAQLDEKAWFAIHPIYHAGLGLEGV